MIVEDGAMLPRTKDAPAAPFLGARILLTSFQPPYVVSYKGHELRSNRARLDRICPCQLSPRPASFRGGDACQVGYG